MIQRLPLLPPRIHQLEVVNVVGRREDLDRSEMISIEQERLSVDLH